MLLEDECLYKSTGAQAMIYMIMNAITVRGLSPELPFQILHIVETFEVKKQVIGDIQQDVV